MTDLSIVFNTTLVPFSSPGVHAPGAYYSVKYVKVFSNTQLDNIGIHGGFLKA